jgi:hypothetical protein
VVTCHEHALIFCHPTRKVYISHVKRWLSTALEANPSPDGRGRWVKLLPKLMAHHNNQFVPGTSIKRCDVTNANFFEMLDSQWKLSDATLAFNSRTFDSENILNLEWKKKVFRFSDGQRVLVARKSLDIKSKDYKKASVIGGWARDVYVVTDCKLKSTRYDTLVPGMS